MNQFSIRLPAEMLREIDAAAQRETRSRSQQIAHYLRKVLEQDGRLLADDAE